MDQWMNCLTYVGTVSDQEELNSYDLIGTGFKVYSKETGAFKTGLACPAVALSPKAPYIPPFTSSESCSSFQTSSSLTSYDASAETTVLHLKVKLQRYTSSVSTPT